MASRLIAQSVVRLLLNPTPTVGGPNPPKEKYVTISSYIQKQSYTELQSMFLFAGLFCFDHKQCHLVSILFYLNISSSLFEKYTHNSRCPWQIWWRRRPRSVESRIIRMSLVNLGLCVAKFCGNSHSMHRLTTQNFNVDAIGCLN